MIHIGIGFLILILLLVIGVPVMYCFGATLLYCAATLGYTATGIFPTIYGKLSSVVLLSIPLFILAGKIMEHGKIGDALIEFIEMFVGKVKGSLAIMTAIACAVFGAICGSGMATLSCIGGVLLLRSPGDADPSQRPVHRSRLGGQPVRDGVLPVHGDPGHRADRADIHYHIFHAARPGY